MTLIVFPGRSSCLMNVLTGRKHVCEWTTVERDSAFDCTIRIYKELKTDLKAKRIYTWCSYVTTLIICVGMYCEVEHGYCTYCKKSKVTLAMTSQTLGSSSIKKSSTASTFG